MDGKMDGEGKSWTPEWMVSVWGGGGGGGNL